VRLVWTIRSASLWLSIFIFSRSSRIDCNHVSKACVSAKESVYYVIMTSNSHLQMSAFKLSEFRDVGWEGGKTVAGNQIEHSSLPPKPNPQPHTSTTTTTMNIIQPTTSVITMRRPYPHWLQHRNVKILWIWHCWGARHRKVSRLIFGDHRRHKQWNGRHTVQTRIMLRIIQISLLSTLLSSTRSWSLGSRSNISSNKRILWGR
jgi:hypothetical protein